MQVHLNLMWARSIVRTIASATIAASTMLAQEPLREMPTAAVPQAITCGVHGEAEALCGAHHPEDLEPTPDGKYLIATSFLDEHPTGPVGGGMDLFDLKKKTFSKIAITDEPDSTWGDPKCPGPIGDALVSHGESLARRSDGKWALYVVNHARRESIEMFELKPAAEGWALVWHGCEVGAHAYNDVAILPDGGFVGTQPLALLPKGEQITRNAGITGYVARWTPGRGESEIANTRMRFPNGVVVSRDGHSMYVNEFLAGHVLKYDLDKEKKIGSVTVDFLPDNLTWTPQGNLLSAGIKMPPKADCPGGSGPRCALSFGIAEIEPKPMQMRVLYNSESHHLRVAGVTVALRVGDSLYLGSFVSDRIVKIPMIR